MIVSRVDHFVLGMALDSAVIAQQSSQGFSSIHYARCTPNVESSKNYSTVAERRLVLGQLHF